MATRDQAISLIKKSVSMHTLEGKAIYEKYGFNKERHIRHWEQLPDHKLEELATVCMHSSGMMDFNDNIVVDGTYEDFDFSLYYEQIEDYSMKFLFQMVSSNPQELQGACVDWSMDLAKKLRMKISTERLQIEKTI